MCAIVPNFLLIGQCIAEIWPFFDFSIWRPYVIWDFQKLEILTAGKLRRVIYVIVPNFMPI